MTDAEKAGQKFAAMFDLDEIAVQIARGALGASPPPGTSPAEAMAAIRNADPAMAAGIYRGAANVMEYMAAKLQRVQ